MSQCNRTPFAGGGGSICTRCGALAEQACIGKPLVPEVDFIQADETASLATLGTPENGWLESSGFSAYAVAVLARSYLALRRATNPKDRPEEVIRVETFRDLLYDQPAREVGGEAYVARFDVESVIAQCLSLAAQKEPADG